MTKVAIAKIIKRLGKYNVGLLRYLNKRLQITTCLLHINLKWKESDIIYKNKA